jgi:hypothetical protein
MFLKHGFFLIAFLIGFSSLNGVALGQQKDIETVLAQRLATERKTILENGKRISTTGIALSEICDLENSVANRVFREYGAMFVGNSRIYADFKQAITGNQIRFLVNCVFQNEQQVALYQANVPSKTATIGGVTVELQADALDALMNAIAEARGKNLRITPRGGSMAAKRTYQDTVTLWNSRFYPALSYWTGRGRISRRDAEAVKSYDIQRQVEQVLEWEDQKIWFSKDLSKSILYSVAAPGASQHIFMLALDIEQFANKDVRAILARHGWFQTVKSDLPHFTYLGVEELQLPSLGLQAVFVSGQKFWIPKMN